MNPSLAQARRGHLQEAAEIFERLLHYGELHLDDEVVLDYFAVSLPDFLVFDENLNCRNRIHCQYMMALGHLGLGNHSQAEICFEAILKVEPDHLGAKIHLRMMNGGNT
jgi:hypothetical protein